MADIYRASHVLVVLGWVDLDLGSSPGWWAATVATYCPSRVVKHPNPSQQNPIYGDMGHHVEFFLACE